MLSDTLNVEGKLKTSLDLIQFFFSDECTVLGDGASICN